MSDSIYIAALKLAEKGFHVFPLIQNSKLPAIADFPSVASNDKSKVTAFFVDPVLLLEQPFNVGISTSRFGDKGESIFVLDVDNKGEKNGSQTLLELLRANDQTSLPPTFTQLTPTGGLHYFFKYKLKEKNLYLKQGTNVLGVGLDIRSKGGYVVGAPSTLEGQPYKVVDLDCEIATAPDWLVESLLTKTPPEELSLESEQIVLNDKEIEAAKTRALNYLTSDQCPKAIEGSGGDAQTFKVICHLKDLGIPRDLCRELLLDNWNETHAIPPWDFDELSDKIKNAYKYGKNKVGANSPQNEFTVIEKQETPVNENPIDSLETDDEKIEKLVNALNEKHCLVVVGGASVVASFNRDKKEAPFELWSINGFNNFYANQKIYVWGKSKNKTDIWLTHRDRNSAIGLFFDPSKGPKFEGKLNLFRGFSVDPFNNVDEMDAFKIANPKAKEGRDLFLEHVYENICQGDLEQFNWAIGFFAHLFQRPTEKPATAMVLRGLKGTGKNVLVDTIADLIGEYALITANRRYLTSNFNSFLETNLLLGLDEAFWSGDKANEGILKNLISESKMVVERKGLEPYRANNYSRIVILGNENWLAPSSLDERRFSVFDVGNAKRMDTEFFGAMKKSLNQLGGNRLLLHYFQKEVDLKDFNRYKIVKTKGLSEQKIHSFNEVERWIYENFILDEPQLSDFDLISENQGPDNLVWGKKIEIKILMSRFEMNKKLTGSHGWSPNRFVMGSAFQRLLGAETIQFRPWNGGKNRTRVPGIYFPTREFALDHFKKVVGDDGFFGAKVLTDINDLIE